MVPKAHLNLSANGDAPIDIINAAQDNARGRHRSGFTVEEVRYILKPYLESPEDRDRSPPPSRPKLVTSPVQAPLPTVPPAVVDVPELLQSPADGLQQYLIIVTARDKFSSFQQAVDARHVPSALATLFQAWPRAFYIEKELLAPAPPDFPAAYCARVLTEQQRMDILGFLVSIGYARNAGFPEQVTTYPPLPRNLADDHGFFEGASWARLQGNTYMVNFISDEHVLSYDWEELAGVGEFLCSTEIDTNDRRLWIEQYAQRLLALAKREAVEHLLELAKLPVNTTVIDLAYSDSDSE